VAPRRLVRCLVGRCDREAQTLDEAAHVAA
jgi:hypothetical protein